MCWCVCVTILWMDCGGCEWNTIRNILIANTDVENSKKLLVFILSAHYHTLHSTPNIVITTVTLNKRFKAPTDPAKSFSKLFSHKIKEININDTSHRKPTRARTYITGTHMLTLTQCYAAHTISYLGGYHYLIISCCRIFIYIRIGNRSERKSVRLSSLPSLTAVNRSLLCCLL